MAELLELRDGQGSAAARAHLDECEACQVELNRLHQRVAALKALPSLHPPRDRWTAVREAVVTNRRRRLNRRAMLTGLVAAAALVAAVGVQGILRHEPTVVEGSGSIAYPIELESLVGESQRLEGMLGTVTRNGRVVDGLTASAIADLEDRIALVDAGIEQAAATRASQNEVASLWQQRVALMDALVTVHVRRVAYEGF
jgi:uncharacterized small protein (DUF1192 family)